MENLPEMRKLTEAEQAIMYIALGNPGKLIESVHYEVDENGWRTCITKFEDCDYYNDWSSEMTSAFNREFSEWVIKEIKGVN